MTILALDYGRQHIGLATATSPLAEPLKIISRQNALESLTQIVKEHHITHLVFGLSENQMAAETIKFAHQLSRMVKLPVSFQDETLSSHETRVQVARAGLKKSRREQKIDHLVAAHILQEYLDDIHPFDDET